MCPVVEKSERPPQKERWKMAKIRLGGMAAQASGSMGGIVYSRNRYGAYIRARSVPTKSMTEFALAAKARMSTISAGFQSLTGAQKAAWQEWALVNVKADVFGEKQPLTAAAAYNGINVRRMLMAQVPLLVPSLLPAPNALKTLSLTGDIGAGSVTAVYTATPVGANDVLWLKACVVDSAGIAYVQNYLKFIGISAFAQASPYDFQSQLEARFGTLQVGQILHVEIAVCSGDSGLLSQPLSAKVVLTST
jgi:hypothetical protein